MSVSIYFQAVIPVDGDLYCKHKAVRDACDAAGVDVPEQTEAFFNEDDEEREVTADGIRVSICEHSRVKAVTGDVMYRDGAVIDLAKLPPGTSHIRVFAKG